MQKPILRLACLLLLQIVTLSVFAQNSKDQMGLYNVGLGAVVGGLGAVINKSPEQKIGSVFLKGLGQGAFGGLLVHQSKLLLSKIPENSSFKYAWYAKVTSSVGNSVIENATSNRNFYEQVNVHLGFNRVEFHTDKFKIRYRVLPVAFLLTAYVATQAKFDPERSLQTGELLFTGSKVKTVLDYKGVTIGTAAVIDNSHRESFEVYSHELVHIYQYHDFNFVNTFATKYIQRIKPLQKASKLLYYDFQGPVMQGIYWLQNPLKGDYYGNSFEREAGIYSGSISND